METGTVELDSIDLGVIDIDSWETRRFAYCEELPATEFDRLLNERIGNFDRAWGWYSADNRRVVRQTLAYLNRMGDRAPDPRLSLARSR